MSGLLSAIVEENLDQDEDQDDLKNDAAHSKLLEIEVQTKPENQDESRHHTYLKKILLWVSIIFVCSVTAGGYTIPIIIYAMDADRGDGNTTIVSFDDNCSNTTAEVCKLLFCK